MEIKTYVLLDENKISYLKLKLKQQEYKQVTNAYWTETFVKNNKQITIKRYI